MKQIIVALSLLVFSINGNTQSLVAKIPSNATMVVKYAGENFSKNVPIQKMDTYKFIKKSLFPAMKIDTLTSLQNMGINLEQDSYQYVIIEDTSMSFVTMMQIKNTAKFEQLIKSTYSSTKKTELKNGYEFIAISENTYVGWNTSTAIIVNTTYQNKMSYYDYKYRNDTATYTAAVDTAVYIITELPVEEVVTFTPPKIYKEGYKTPKKKKGVVKGKSKAAVKKGTKKKTIETYEEIEESAGIQKEVEAPYIMSAEDSLEQRNRELWEQQQDMLVKKKQQDVAEKIMINTFSGSIKSIENTISYKKIIELNAHISVWLNSDHLIKQYQNFFAKGMYGLLKYMKPAEEKEMVGALHSAINIYFEKDKMRMEQKTFFTDAEMENLSKAVMDNKQSATMLNYINPNNIGYFSASINTEAMVNYYYTSIKKYLSNTPFVGEYSDVIDVYIDLLQIMIDEKGIADLTPGNYLFVMHDMKTKQVEYTDYIYDKEYNSTPVKKMKKELSPNFSFVMDTRKEDFMQKLAKLPLKYAKKEKLNYMDKGGYYELAFDSAKYPVSSLYFMIKNGKGIVTTNKEVIENTIANKGFTTDEETKSFVLNNNYAAKISSKKLFEILESEANTKINKQICAYMKENMGDIKTEMSYKEGMIQGTSIVKINGNHTNSLEWFFNTIESINNIYDEAKVEEYKRVD